MLLMWVGIAGIVGGYILSIFTWTPVHTFFIGAQNKASQLRQQAKALLSKV